MGILEGIVIAVLLYSGAFFHGYSSKDDKIAKTINLQIPKDLKEKYKVKDCFEKKDESCDDLIPKPRYIVSEREYRKLSAHCQERKLYLNVCEDTINTYNKDKYVED